MEKQKGMIKLFAMLFVLFIFATVPDVFAKEISRQCSVSVSYDYAPAVFFNGDIRSNPDGSYYPGDAVHFLFSYSASDTCAGVTLKPLEISSNVKVNTILKTAQNMQPVPFSVTAYDIVPKYIDVHNYYQILKADTVCTVHRGGKQTCSTSYVYSEKPILSIRQDMLNVPGALDSISVDVDKYGGKKIRDNIHDVITQNWFLVKQSVSPKMGVFKHPNEDESSVNSFNEFVLQRCSHLSKYDGCVFGHAEIAPFIKKQYCLFEELDMMGVSYDKNVETDMCIADDYQNLLTMKISGVGTSCSDKKCTSYIAKSEAYMGPRILQPNGIVNFEYPNLKDVDGFPTKNPDGTWYLDDAIGIKSMPDALFRLERSGTITFDTAILYNPLQYIDSESCDGRCDVVISGEKISDTVHDIINGDTVSAFFTSEILGRSDVEYFVKMYNLGQYVANFTGIADPLVVVYKPQINSTYTWSRLADGGYQSFDNQYAVAVKYDGSFGGGPDDATGIHSGRKMKVNSFLNSYFISNPLGLQYPAWNPLLKPTVSQGLQDVRVPSSVYRYIPGDYGFVDTFESPANVFWNDTSKTTLVDSAGYMRLLFDLQIPKNAIDLVYDNVTSYDTLSTINYGGMPRTWLSSSAYDFPWGVFSVPINMTAYVSQNNTRIDDATNITSVRINDFVENNFISNVEFYLHGQNDKSVSFLHMADLYEMNTKINLNCSTCVVLLNKTGVAFDSSSYNALASYTNMSGFTRQDVLSGTDRIFAQTPSYYDIEISASNAGVSSTNSFHVGGIDAAKTLNYIINMNKDNYMSVNKVEDNVLIRSDPYFGNIVSVFANGVPVDFDCSNDCFARLDNSGTVSLEAENMWGGISHIENLAGIDTTRHDHTLWSDVLLDRLFWIVVVLVILYVSYRALKELFASRK